MAGLEDIPDGYQDAWSNLHSITEVILPTRSENRAFCPNSDRIKKIARYGPKYINMWKACRAVESMGVMAGDETDWDCSHCILPITGGTGNQSQSGGRRCQTGSQSQLGQCQTDSQSQCTVGQNLKQGG